MNGASQQSGEQPCGCCTGVTQETPETISNRPALTPDMAILIYLNTDQNSATGDPQSLGADYVIQLIPGAIGLFQWNGSDYVAAQSQTSLIFSYDTTGPTTGRTSTRPAVESSNRHPATSRWL